MTWWFRRQQKKEDEMGNVPTPWPPLHQDWPTESRGLEDPIEEVRLVSSGGDAKQGAMIADDHSHTHTTAPHIEATPEDIRNHCFIEAHRLTNEACDALDLAYRHLKVVDPETAERVRKVLNTVTDLTDHTEYLADV